MKKQRRKPQRQARSRLQIPPPSSLHHHHHHQSIEKRNGNTHPTTQAILDLDHPLGAMTTPTPTFLFPAMEKRPKSPKSPKPTLENPLLKNPQFLLGSSFQAPSLISEHPPRSPLMPLNPNSATAPKTTFHAATPGPPPKASLSLMGMVSIEPSTPAPPLRHQPQQHTTPLTPPPISSPPLLRPDTAAVVVSHESSTHNHWVVAYGYTNREEYQELLEVLTSHGPILQKQESSSNWLAIQYEGLLAAEKALCSQPLRLAYSGALCGTVRGSPQLLQGLQARSHNLLLTASKEPTTTTLTTNNNALVYHKSSSLNEEDILAQCVEGDEAGNRRSTSVCDKLFAWYFGWSDDNKHSQYHPHTD